MVSTVFNGIGQAAGAGCGGVRSGYPAPQAEGAQFFGSTHSVRCPKLRSAQGFHHS